MTGHACGCKDLAAARTSRETDGHMYRNGTEHGTWCPHRPPAAWQPLLTATSPSPHPVAAPDHAGGGVAGLHLELPGRGGGALHRQVGAELQLRLQARRDEGVEHLRHLQAQGMEGMVRKWHRGLTGAVPVDCGNAVMQAGPCWSAINFKTTGIHPCCTTYGMRAPAAAGSRQGGGAAPPATCPQSAAPPPTRRARRPAAVQHEAKGGGGMAGCYQAGTRAHTLRVEQGVPPQALGAVPMPSCRASSSLPPTNPQTHLAEQDAAHRVDGRVHVLRQPPLRAHASRVGGACHVRAQLGQLRVGEPAGRWKAVLGGL